MVVPSQSRILEATHEMVLSVSIRVTAALIQAGSGRASLLRKATYSPRAASALRLHPPAKPRFLVDATTLTSGKRPRSRSTLPSPDALSTTISSSSSLGQSKVRQASRHVAVSEAPL